VRPTATIRDGQGAGTIASDDVAGVTKSDLMVDIYCRSVVHGQKLAFSYVVKSLGGGMSRPMLK
jgi:hypothetical protein